MYAGLLGGGTGSSFGERVAVDSADNVYVAGYTSAADFPTANSAFPQYKGSNDGFVTKINASGTAVLYSTYIGGSGTEYLYGVAADSAGAAWVTGQTTSPDFPVLNPLQSTLSGTSNNAVVFKLGPTGALLYSTYLGGTGGSYGEAMAVDASGNAYAAGYAGAGFPTTSGVYLAANQGSYDGFVAKFSSSGSIVYATYIGGASADYIYGIAVDSSGDAYAAGQTYSPSFPSAPPGGVQALFAGVSDGFVAKLNPAGTALLYFTYLGGSSWDWANGIAVDGSGNAYIAGGTMSSNFPTTPGALQETIGNAASTNLYRGFVTKLNAAGSAFVYSTYFGGNRFDYLCRPAIDAAGDVFVTGYTDSDQFPTVAAVQRSLPGNPTSLFQTTNSGASWSAFDANLPGKAYAVSVDPSNSSIIVASTEGGTFRTTDGGASWSLRLAGPGASYLSRSPADSSTIYWVYTYGVSRSTDGGVSWSFRGGVGASSLSGIVADPLNANTAYAFYNSGSSPLLYKTTDGGATWPLAIGGLPANRVVAMAAAPDGSLYAAVYSYGVYKSTDQGTSWTAVSTGLPSPFYPGGGLTASSNSAPVLYLTAYQSGSYVVYKTTDGAAHWSATPGTPPASVSSIVASPQNASVVYAIASAIPSLYESTDGGSTWNAAAAGLGVASTSQLAFDPSNASAAYVTAGVNWAAFVSEINPSGSTLVYSTYLGGSGSAQGYGIAANSSGDAFITGYDSDSFDRAFPATTSALQGIAAYSSEAFLVRISDVTAPCRYALSPATDWISGASRPEYYNILAPSGCAWMFSSDSSWATVVSGASGAGMGVVGVAVSADNTGSTRTATFTAGGQTATLTQADASCGFSRNPSNAVLPAAGGTLQVQINVTGGPGCAWHVYNVYTSAISVLSGGTGTDNGTVVVSVAPNPNSSSRTFTLDMANGYVIITQGGTAGPPCTFSLGSSTALFGGNGGAGSVALTASGGACAWTAASGASWLTITSGASGMGSGTVTYSVAPNTGSDRTGTLTIAGLTFTVTSLQALQVTQITPNSGLNTGAVNVSLVGSGFMNGAQVKLTAAGPPDILGTNVAFLTSSALTASFGLSGATPGPRDLAITNPNGDAFVAPAAFSIGAPVSCSYSISPSSQSFASAGGSGNFVVTASSAQCTWSASFNASWITSSPTLIPHFCTVTVNGCASYPVVGYSVAANSSTAPRSGTITITSQSATVATFTVTQAGQACTYAINPASVSFAANGGGAAIAVTTQTGCSWTTSGNPAWVTVNSGSSGSGNGSVSITVAANPDGARSANLTIATNTFAIAQAALAGTPACGATDVSGLVSVTRGALMSGFLGNYYTGKVTFKNNSSQMINGPIYLVLNGLPRSCTLNGQITPTTCGLSPAPSLTHCGSAQGSYLQLVSGGGLAAGQSVSFTLTFLPGGAASSSFNYAARVFSGTPNQ